MIKKIILIFVLFSINFEAYGNSNQPTATASVPDPIKSEEELCFEILNEKIKNDTRFKKIGDVMPKGDLTEVLLSEAGGSYINLSDYNNFQKYLAVNPAHNNGRSVLGLNKNDFLSRRTNIATIITNDPFVVSQVVGFGRDSNFDFPVETKGKEFGDKYKLNGNNFKEFVLYTHHSIKGDFLSCGIFHLTPLNGRTYGNVAETGYFTNTLQGNKNQNILGNKKCSSGFEGEYVNRESKKFYSMKTNVCALDYAQEDFVRQEILAVAYDNNSSFFNEYLIFPLQVTAMKNTDTTSSGLVNVSDKFLKLVEEKTCLELIHGKKNNLPNGCNKNYNSIIISKNINILFSLKNFIFPSTLAAREFNFSDEQIEASTGMVVFDSLPYDLYKKLENIPNKNFIEYVKIALNPTFEEYIKYRKENGIVISDFEEIFLACEIDYIEREKIIIDFLNKLEKPENFDISNITYLNKKFGDCIIPYPDKENRNKIIDNSFSSNKLLAEKLSGTYIENEVDEIIKKFIEKENQIDLTYQNEINKLTQLYNEGLINSEELEKRTYELRIKRETEIINLENEFNIENKENKIDFSSDDKIDDKIDNKIYLIVTILLLIGLSLIYKSYKNKNK